MALKKNPKYPDCLDPIREDYKKEKSEIMGELRCYFAPHEGEHRFAYTANVFGFQLRDPVGPNAGYPRFLVCHMCGEQYGPSSLESHFKVCEEKWNGREEQREPGEPVRDIPRGPGVTPADPLNWTREEVDAYNEEARKIFEEGALFKCDKCGRTFNEESFAAHFNGCDKPEVAGMAVKPCELCGKLLFGAEHRVYHKRKCRACFWDLPTCTREIGPACYVCGKECSARSIDKHVAECEKLWVLKEENKVYEDDRLPLPSKIGGSGGWEAQKQALLGCGEMKTCDNCGRCFNKDSYEKHKRGCGQEQTLENFLKSQKSMKPKEPVLGCEDGYFRKFVKNAGEKGVACYICSRKFGNASIEIHVQNCIHMWQEREKAKSDREEKRPVPDRPAQFDAYMARKMTLAAWNKWAFENCGLYVPCKNCGRTFLPEQLSKHRRGCKPAGARGEWRG